MFYGFNNKEDVDFFQSALQRFGQIFGNVFAADNLILIDRNLAYLNDKKFEQACGRNAHNDQERSLVLRLNTLIWAASEALRLPGDFVECGVFRGFCSAVIVDDIVTTGTTVREAARALSEAGWQVSGAAVVVATPRGDPKMSSTGG